MDSFTPLSDSPSTLARMFSPQRNDFSPSDVSGQQGVDLWSRLSCVVPFVYGEVVLSPQCINPWHPGCIEQDKPHASVYAGVLCPLTSEGEKNRCFEDNNINILAAP